MKSLFKLYFGLMLVLLGVQLDAATAYSNNCTSYTDAFGPLKTGYTMGDIVRYSVTPSQNMFSPDVEEFAIQPPAFAQDIYNFASSNNDNLYNALGYLYAGWVYNNTGGDKTKWVKEYRSSPSTSLNEFDNSQNFANPINVPFANIDLKDYDTFLGWTWIHSDVYADGSMTYGKDTFTNCGGSGGTDVNSAANSGGWCPNTVAKNWLALTSNKNPGGTKTLGQNPGSGFLYQQYNFLGLE